MLFAVPTSIWGCTPVDRFWYTSKPGHCINVYAQAMAVSIFDTALDIAILLLPMPQVLRLQMKLSKRLLIAGVFVFGYWYVKEQSCNEPEKMLTSEQRFGRINRPLGR